MRRSSFAGLFGFILSIALGALPPANALAAVTELEAHAIGVDPYLYFYPLVTMDITRKQSTNIEPGKGVWQGSDEHVQQPADLSARRFQGCGAAKLRHFIFQRMARLD